MAKHTIFTQSIIVEEFINNNLKEEIIKELQINKNLNKGRVITNRGGFQSHDIVNEFILKTIGEKCVETLNKHYEIKTKNIQLCNLWINENYKDNFNIAHIHPNSHFSGVYYIDTTETGGELLFYNTDISVFSDISSYISNDNDFFHHYSIKPKNNIFILFPSYFKHMVMPHKEEKARISISFNVRLYNG